VWLGLPFPGDYRRDGDRLAYTAACVGIHHHDGPVAVGHRQGQGLRAEPLT
jgi:hypothetical protein